MPHVFRNTRVSRVPGYVVRERVTIFAFDGAALTQFQLDPHRSAFAPHHRVMRAIYESLVVALPGHRFGPWLAKSWELAPDGLSYTFELREDVKFHDGTAFDAEAVKFNLDRIQDPKTAAYSFTAIGPYEGSDVLGPHRVRVRFQRPYAPFLANLASTSLAIASPTAVKKLGFGIAQAPVGTGPFRFKSQAPGTEIVVERNPEYRWPVARPGDEPPSAPCLGFGAPNTHTNQASGQPFRSECGKDPSRRRRGGTQVRPPRPCRTDLIRLRAQPALG